MSGRFLLLRPSHAFLEKTCISTPTITSIGLKRYGLLTVFSPCTKLVGGKFRYKSLQNSVQAQINPKSESTDQQSNRNRRLSERLQGLLGKSPEYFVLKDRTRLYRYLFPSLITSLPFKKVRNRSDTTNESIVITLCGFSITRELEVPSSKKIAPHEGCFDEYLGGPGASFLRELPV